MSARLAILEQSLAKKTATMSAKIENHFATVAQANGQPLNDKRNGAATMAKWERQNDAIRNAQSEIEKTERAIDREKSLISNVENSDVPACLQGFIASGKVTQWRKHPRFFFVTGVDKARIVALSDGTIGHRYVSEITNDQSQYATFRDVFNAARALQSSQ